MTAVPSPVDPASVTVEDTVLSVHGRRLAARWVTPPGAAAAPVIVFLHEALGAIRLWKDFPERLCAATGLRGLVYERLGYGASDPMEAERSADYLRVEAEDWLPEVLRVADVTAPPILFGHSDGGSIALYYAAKHPVAAMVTEAAHIYIEEITLQGIRDFATELWAKTDIRDKLARYHGDKTDAVYHAWHDTWLKPEMADFDMSDCLPRIACPAMIVQGSDDEYGSPSQVTDIVAGITAGGKGAARAWFLDGCGHIPHLERKDEVAFATAAFLAEVLPTA